MKNILNIFRSTFYLCTLITNDYIHLKSFFVQFYIKNKIQHLNSGVANSAEKVSKFVAFIALVSACCTHGAFTDQNNVRFLSVHRLKSRKKHPDF